MPNEGLKGQKIIFIRLTVWYDWCQRGFKEYILNHENLDGANPARTQL